ncbi:MAG: hypothetical protein K1X92_06095, partial [Bacteroidia bacterium]|nr:hypothetical protein [Bacteroidia bacterium]
MKNHVLWVRSIIGIALWLFWSVGYGQLNANWSIPGYSWEYQYGGSGTDRVLSVTETNDGGFIYFGVTNSTNGDVVGNHGGYDIWIVKTDSNGTGGWKKCIGGSGNDSLRQVFPMPNGHYLLLGHTTSNNGDISGNHGGKDGWLAEIDSAGGIVWQKCLGGTGNDNLVQGIIRNGVITMMGNTLSSDGDVSGSLGGQDIWVLQTDMSGNLL